MSRSLCHRSIVFSTCFVGPLLMAFLAVGQATPTTAIGAAWAADVLSKEALATKLDETEKELEAIPADAKPETPEGQLRTALNRRIELLKELFVTVEQREKIQAQRQTLPKRKADLEAKVKALESLRPLQAPTQPIAGGAEQIKETLDAQRKTLETLKGEASDRSDRVEEIPALRAKTTERGTAAEAAIAHFGAELAATQEGPQKVLLTVRLDNAELERRLTKECLVLFDEDIQLETEASAYRNQAIDYQQQLLARTEQEHGLYQQVMARLRTEQQKAAEAALAKTQEEAQAAVTERQKFIARWEQKIAQTIASKAALETRKTVLATLTLQQDRRIDAERDRLKMLKDLVSRVGTGERGGERIKAIYHHIRDLRRTPQKIFGPPVHRDLELDRARRFELDESILTLADTWREQFDIAVATVAAGDTPAFEAIAVTLRDNYRKALLEEQVALGEIISAENKLQNLGVELSGVIDDLEEFVLPKLYWIRDSEPIGAKTIVKLRSEVSRLTSWATGLLGQPTRARLTAKVSSVPLIVLAIVLLVFFAASLYFRARLHRVLSIDHTGERKVRSTVLAVARASILPAYLFAAAVMFYATDLPESLGVVLSKLLFHLGVVVFLWSITHSVFRAGGLAERQHAMRPATTKAVLRSLTFVLLAYLVWLLPWVILKDPPFRYDALPRVGYILFGICTLVPVALLTRKSSSLMQDLQEPGRSSQIFEHWTIISGFLVAVFVGTIVMDVLGFRFGGFKIATATLLSLLTIVTLLALYRIVVPVMTRVLRSRKSQFTAAPGETPQTSTVEREQQVRGFLKTCFALLGLLLIAVYWGINERAIHVLDGMHIWRASAEPLIWVSVADVLKCVATIILTVWVLKHLPGLYEVAVFPRLQLDAGIRYAILTISRYGLFLLGALIALASIELNLTQIGWLMAAIGFGLGFGMQEIFSNFVSGLILLIERPVRVGDIVKIGEVLGTVKRINIRATTVVSFDRLENIIPNKDLITKAVTNWTLADKTTRLIIPIGIAYGSDVDEVRSLLLNLAMAQPEILKDPAPTAFFIGHGNSSLDFELRFFVEDPGLRMPLQDRLNTLINKELSARGIEIPFPQRDVHVKMEKWPKDIAHSLAAKETDEK